MHNLRTGIQRNAGFYYAIHTFIIVILENQGGESNLVLAQNLLNAQQDDALPLPDRGQNPSFYRKMDNTLNS